MKKTLATILAAATLASSANAIDVHGHLDLSYVPLRADDHYEINELKTELEVRLEEEFGDFTPYIGGRSRTYSGLPDDTILFDPHRQEYDFFGGLRFDNFDLYFTHTCGHPVQSTHYDERDQRERWITDEDTGEQYYVNHDSITELGLKIKF